MGSAQVYASELGAAALSIVNMKAICLLQ